MKKAKGKKNRDSSSTLLPVSLESRLEGTAGLGGKSLLVEGVGVTATWGGMDPVLAGPFWDLEAGRGSWVLPFSASSCRLT